MPRKFILFVTSLLALSTMLLLPAAAQTDETYDRAVSNGRFRLDGINGTAVNVNAFLIEDDDLGYTEIFGQMSLISDSQFASASVATEDYSYVTMDDGNDYPHAEITSVPFVYIDLVSGNVYNIYMVIDLTEYGPHGQSGFQVISADDGSVLVESDVDGSYAEVPFLIGHVSITE